MLSWILSILIIGIFIVIGQYTAHHDLKGRTVLRGYTYAWLLIFLLMAVMQRDLNNHYESHIKALEAKQTRLDAAMEDYRKRPPVWNLYPQVEVHVQSGLPGFAERKGATR